MAAAAIVFSRAVPMEAPICWEVLVMAEVTPDVLRVGVLGGRADAGHDGQPQSEAQEELARQHVGHVGGVGRQLGEEGDAERRQQEAGDDQQPGPHVRHQAAGHLGRRQPVEGHQGEEGDAGLERRVVVDGLEQVGEEEERPEHPGDGQQDGQERARPGSGCAATRSGRSGLGPLLCHRMNAPSSTPATTRATMTSVAAPSARAGLAEPVDEGHQAAAAEDDAEHVEPDARDALARRGSW